MRALASLSSFVALVVLPTTALAGLNGIPPEAPIPEPSSMLLMGIGVGIVYLAQRRQR